MSGVSETLHQFRYSAGEPCDCVWGRSHGQAKVAGGWFSGVVRSPRGPHVRAASSAEQVVEHGGAYGEYMMIIIFIEVPNLEYLASLLELSLYLVS